MKGFKFNVEQTIEFMEHSTAVNRMQNELTLYAVVCLNEDHESSHGGVIASVIDGKFTESSVRGAIDEAVAGAMDANESDAEGKTCKYVPLAIGLDPALLDDLAAQLYNQPSKRDRPLVIGPQDPQDAEDQ